jgi:hypothetical protein
LPFILQPRSFSKPRPLSGNRKYNRTTDMGAVLPDRFGRKRAVGFRRCKVQADIRAARRQCWQISRQSCHSGFRNIFSTNSAYWWLSAKTYRWALCAEISFILSITRCGSCANAASKRRSIAGKRRQPLGQRQGDNAVRIGETRHHTNWTIASGGMKKPPGSMSRWFCCVTYLIGLYICFLNVPLPFAAIRASSSSVPARR